MTAEKPNHYRRTIKGQEIQVFDIEAAWGLNQYHNLASAVEYILRAPHKGSMMDDIKKAIVHLQNFLELPHRNPCKEIGKVIPVIGTWWKSVDMRGGRPGRVHWYGKAVEIRESTAVLEAKDGYKIEWGFSFFSNLSQLELAEGTWLVPWVPDGEQISQDLCDPDYEAGEINRGS